MIKVLTLTLALAVALAGFSLGAAAGQNDARLGPLFEQLRKSTSPAEAEIVESLIWSIWVDAENANVDARMTRGMAAMRSGNHEAALREFDTVTKAAPDFAEGWNKRATIHFLMGDYRASVGDIKRTLALEPRHFGALSGLGMIYLGLGEDAAALKVFQGALEIHPNMEGVRGQVKTLQRKLRGKAI